MEARIKADRIPKKECLYFSIGGTKSPFPMPQNGSESAIGFGDCYKQNLSENLNSNRFSSLKDSFTFGVFFNAT